MGRKPIGEVAMTPAERQRKRRERLDNKERRDWSPPAADFKTRGRLTFWLEEGDEEEVAQFLSEFGPRRSPG
jgi:hypothetical protein